MEGIVWLNIKKYSLSNNTCWKMNYQSKRKKVVLIFRWWIRPTKQLTDTPTAKIYDIEMLCVCVCVGGWGNLIRCVSLFHRSDVVQMPFSLLTVSVLYWINYFDLRAIPRFAFLILVVVLI